MKIFLEKYNAPSVAIHVSLDQDEKIELEKFKQLFRYHPFVMTQHGSDLIIEIEGHYNQ